MQMFLMVIDIKETWIKTINWLGKRLNLILNKTFEKGKKILFHNIVPSMYNWAN